MKWIALLATATVLAIVGRGAQLWLAERNRRTVFAADDAAALLNPLRRLIQRPESVVRAFRIKAGDVVLEVGPGPGYFSPVAAAAVLPGGRLICLDVQPEMLSLLRERLFQSSNSKAVDLVAGDAMHLPFRPNTIDASYMVAVLGEIPSGDASVAELMRVLRPGGTASFCETFNDPDYVRLQHLREMCSNAGLRPIEWRRQLIGYIARYAKPG